MTWNSVVGCLYIEEDRSQMLLLAKTYAPLGIKVLPKTALSGCKNARCSKK